MMAKQITLKRGRTTKRVVLVAPPYPEAGDVVTIDGEPWTVSKVANTRVIASIPMPKEAHATA